MVTIPEAEYARLKAAAEELERLRSEVPLVLSAMARRARVPVAWLKAEAEAGRVPCLRAGRVLLFNPTVVLKMLLERAASQHFLTQTSSPPL